jgi:hypothetical protein
MEVMDPSFELVNRSLAYRSDLHFTSMFFKAQPLALLGVVG